MSTSEVGTSGPSGSSGAAGSGTRRRAAGFGGTRRRRGQREQKPPEAGPDDELTQDPEGVARRILLTRLTSQARTRAQLADTLAEKGVPDDVAERVLDRFGEVGLVDDAAFARSWVESRHHGRGLAKRALAHELRQKGVTDEVAREALDDLDDDTQADTARDLVRRKLRSVQGMDRQKAMRRLLGMLGRKGYPPGVAMQVVKDELDGAANGDEGSPDEEDASALG